MLLFLPSRVLGSCETFARMIAPRCVRVVFNQQVFLWFFSHYLPTLL